MYPFQRILVPTDFSLCAEAAYHHALYLAQRYKAEVYLLHVVRRATNSLRQDHDVAWPDRVTRSRSGRPANTEHWHGLLLHRVILQSPDPVTAILDYAQEKAIDFIVMGAHGDRGAGQYLNRGVGSAFLGHTTEQVVRHATCPVLRVVMADGRHPDQVRRILAPLDLSSLSLLGLAYAKDLASLYNARLDLLHVVEQASTQDADEDAPKRDELIDLFKKTKGPDVSAGFHVVQGRPDRMIQAFVKDRAVDMIVLGAHSDLGQDVLGIVAEQVVRTAPCSVLTVRKGASEARTSSRSERAFPLPFAGLL